MGRRGYLPAGDSKRATHAWTEVRNVPFEGGPDLPDDREWPVATRRWWSALRRMPHASLWQESDWGFAVDTAVLHAAMWDGNPRVATELRNRELVLGTTIAARQRAQIRYVEPDPQPTLVAVPDDLAELYS